MSSKKTKSRAHSATPNEPTKTPTRNGPALSRDGGARNTWKLWNHPAFLVILSVLLTALVGVYVVRLTGYWEIRDRLGVCQGELTQTQGQVESAKKLEASLQARVDERDLEIQALKEKSEILDRFGAEFTLFKEFDLNLKEPEELHMGSCGPDPCYVLHVDRVIRKPPTPQLVLALGGALIGTPVNKQQIGISVPLKVGCGAALRSSVYDFEAIVVDDRVASLRLGIAVSEGSLDPSQGMAIIKVCQEK